MRAKIAAAAVYTSYFMVAMAIGAFMFIGLALLAGYTANDLYNYLVLGNPIW